MSLGSMDEVVVSLTILAGFQFLLFVCGLGADHLLPHIRSVERYLESLRDFEDDEEIAARYEEHAQERIDRLLMMIREKMRQKR